MQVFELGFNKFQTQTPHLLCKYVQHTDILCVNIICILQMKETQKFSKACLFMAEFLATKCLHQVTGQ